MDHARRIDPWGFRETDLRWRFPEQIDLEGLARVGQALATQLAGDGADPEVVVGHDLRAHSEAVRDAVVRGLVRGGAVVHDVGCCLTPIALFARGHLGVPGLAMVTASHNPDPWTGLKIGRVPPLTHGPEEIAALRALVEEGPLRVGAGRVVRRDVREAWMAAITAGPPPARPLRVVVGAAHGTAGLFAPEALARAGFEVVGLDTTPDWTFPRYHPNPEHLAFLQDVGAEVRRVGADLGVAFDGDGDRLGVVDDLGRPVFADRVGLLLARGLAEARPGARILVDVKATGLFEADPALRAAGVTVERVPTGHSHVRRRLLEAGALAAFERSGHFYLGAPLGDGRDDAVAWAIRLARELAAGPSPLSARLDALPRSWQSPTLAPACADDRKHEVVAQVRARLRAEVAAGVTVDGAPMVALEPLGGARVRLADGTWGLVRASSNKPVLGVVVESPTSDRRMRALFHHLDALLRDVGDVGDYDQALPPPE